MREIKSFLRWLLAFTARKSHSQPGNLPGSQLLSTSLLMGHYLIKSEGPIKGKDGRVRHIRGVGEKAQETKNLGWCMCYFHFENYNN